MKRISIYTCGKYNSYHHDKNLVHETSLSIAISVLLWVQLVHQTRLLPSGALSAVNTSGPNVIIVVVVSIACGIVLSQRGSSSRASTADCATN